MVVTSHYITRGENCVTTAAGVDDSIKKWEHIPQKAGGCVPGAIKPLQRFPTQMCWIRLWSVLRSSRIQ